MGTLGYQLTNIPQAPDTSVYGKWLMQQGLSAGDVANLQRAKRLDAERKALQEKQDKDTAAKDAADAAYKASLLGIQERQLGLQEKNAELQDAREQRIFDKQEKAFQEAENQNALSEAKQGGFANILARDSDVVPGGVAAPESIQSWLGRVPFKDLTDDEKQVVAGYGQQMGIGLNEIPDVYDTFRTKYIGALTEEEKQLDAQQKALRSAKTSAETGKARQEAAVAKTVVNELETPETTETETIPQNATPAKESDEVSIFGEQFANDLAEINAVRGKKPETVKVNIPGGTMNLPTEKPSLATIPAPGSAPKPAPKVPTAQQARTFQPQEVVTLSKEMAKYPSRAEFMKAAGIKTEAEYKALIAQIAAMKANPIPATTQSRLPRG